MRFDPGIVMPPGLSLGPKINELRRAGRRVISLGLGEPDFPTPPHIVEAACASLRAGHTRYTGAEGLPELRAAIAEKLRRDNGIPARPEEILVTPGAKNALFTAAAALLGPGDEAINVTPCYASNFPILNLAEPAANVHDLDLASPGFDLDLDKLDRLVNARTRLILVNYPNNPTGRMLTPEAASGLATLLLKHPRLWLLADELYDRLALTSREPISLAALEPVRERVVTVNGLSKAHAMTGWRVGYAHGPRAIIARMTAIHQQLNSHVAPFIQKAAEAALTGPQNHVADFVARLKRRKADYDHFLASQSRFRGSTPEGGFFAFLDVSASGLGSDAFCAALLEATGLALLPGITFGARFDSHCRISLAVAGEEFTGALNLLAGFRPPIVRS